MARKTTSPLITSPICYVPPTIDASYTQDGSGPVPGIKNRRRANGTPAVTPGASSGSTKLPCAPVRAALRRAGHSAAPGATARLAHPPTAVGAGKIRRPAAPAGGPQGGVFLNGDVERNKCATGRHHPPRNALSRACRGVDTVRPAFLRRQSLLQDPEGQCTQNSHYDVLDLETLPDDYLPRTNYVPACSESEYRARTPQVPWVEDGESKRRRVTEFYRLVNREMLSQSGERTFIASIFPPTWATFIPALES